MVGLRLPFVLSGALAVVFAALIARELSEDPRAPVFAALLAATAPILQLTGALAMPDAPLEASYAAAAWLLVRARGRGWVLAGFASGIALLSKLSAGLLAPGWAVLFAVDPMARRELRTPWPWLGALVAVAMFSPFLWWNANHDWVSFRFQLHHAFGGGGGLGTILEYAVGQLVAAGPVVLVAGAWFLLRPRTPAAAGFSSGSRVARGR